MWIEREKRPVVKTTDGSPVDFRLSELVACRELREPVERVVDGHATEAKQLGNHIGEVRHVFAAWELVSYSDPSEHNSTEESVHSGVERAELEETNRLSPALVRAPSSDLWPPLEPLFGPVLGSVAFVESVECSLDTKSGMSWVCCEAILA